MAEPTPPRAPGVQPRLLSLASHELRTPLSVVAGYLRMLQRDREEFGERHRKMIDEAEKACSRMIGLAGEISLLGKLEASEPAGRREPLDLLSLVRAVASRDDLGTADVAIAIQDDSQSAKLLGDRDMLSQAFESLIRAVVREQPDPTIILVRLGPLADDTVLVTISRDSDAETLMSRREAPFDEFRGGIGLTLPLARRVIELHGGRIWSPGHDDGTAIPRSGILVLLPATP